MQKPLKARLPFIKLTSAQNSSGGPAAREEERESGRGHPAPRQGQSPCTPMYECISVIKRLAVPALLLMVVLGMLGSMGVYASGIRGRPIAITPIYAPPRPNPNRPVLAFYYAWYTTSTWCLCHMSDLPTIRYNSSDDTTIERQVQWAANAGITGFISSWWGQGDQTDKNFARLLTHSASLESKTGYHFASTIYFESDAPALRGVNNIVKQLRYVLSQYANDTHFLHWHGKPVLFFWNPLGNGRTLSMWASVRRQVDAHNVTIWSAEGVDMSLLRVFDGIHLFSAGYWGILDGNMSAVDKGFRAKIDAYNKAHHTNKIWAAGVLPGYNDTKVPGRKGTYIVPRNNGATYRTSWTAALASAPDWITITTFNEWFEGAMIEPSVTYGNLYLMITQQFARQWHG